MGHRPWSEIKHLRPFIRCEDVVNDYLARRGESLWGHHDRLRREALDDEASREIDRAFNEYDREYRAARRYTREHT